MSNIPLKETVKKILVFKFGGIGDYVCLLPFLEDLRNFYEKAQITAVIAPAGKELLEHNGTVDKCIISKQISLPCLGSILSINAINDICEIISSLDAPYDLFIDVVSKYYFTGILKPWLIKVLSKAMFSIGLHYKKKSFYLDVKILDDRYQAKHNIEKYADILKALGGTPQFHLAKISPSYTSGQKAKDFFRQFDKQINIGLHPGANVKFFSQRAWPAERFAKLAQLIKDNYSCNLFVTGSPQERDLIEKVINTASVKITPIPFTGNIIDFCAYLQELDYYISNDTGPMHLAVAMGVPTVGIFGHADFESYGTYPATVPFIGVTLEKGKKHTYHSILKDPRGLREISVEDVFNKFQELTKNKLSIRV